MRCFQAGVVKLAPPPHLDAERGHGDGAALARLSWGARRELDGRGGGARVVGRDVSLRRLEEERHRAGAVAVIASVVIVVERNEFGTHVRRKRGERPREGAPSVRQ